MDELRNWREEEDFSLHLYSASASVSLPVADHPLSKWSLVPEPSIIQFLAERVQTQPIFKQYLLALIELSKSEAEASQAAANAMTIFVRAGVRFHGADLRGIRVPGADLTAGQFDSAQLQDADLTRVNFTKAWIRQADFTSARMEEARFGELPFLKGRIWALACAFSPDGRFFAVALDSGDLSVLESATWTRICSFCQVHIVTGLAFSPTGLQLLSGGSDKIVRLWNCETGLEDFVLGHREQVTAVAFSPSAHYFASASDDRSVRLWDAQTGMIAFILSDHAKGVTSITFSEDGNSLASSSWDGTVRIFDMVSGLSVWSSGPGKAVYLCLAYSPDGRLILPGDNGSLLRLWTTTILGSETSWKGRDGSVMGVDYSPNGLMVASCGEDTTVKLWDARTRALCSVFTGHSSQVSSVVFSPGGARIASTSYDANTRLWEVNSTEPSFDSQNDDSSSQTCAAFSQDGRSLISCSNTGITLGYCDNTTRIREKSASLFVISTYRPRASRILQTAYRSSRAAVRRIILHFGMRTSDPSRAIALATMPLSIVWPPLHVATILLLAAERGSSEFGPPVL